MKTLKSALMIAMLAMSFAACGGGDKQPEGGDTTKPAEATTEAPAATEPAAAAPDTAAKDTTHAH